LYLSTVYYSVEIAEFERATTEVASTFKYVFPKKPTPNHLQLECRPTAEQALLRLNAHTTRGESLLVHVLLN